MNVRFTSKEDHMAISTDVQLEATATHSWQRGRFTGTVTCAACGLLPLDQDDVETACTGR